MANDAADWAEAGFDPRSAAACEAAGLTPDTAADWLSVGIPPGQAAIFQTAGIPLDIAAECLAAHLYPPEAVDYLAVGLTVEAAHRLRCLGIAPAQISRTVAGLQVDLHEWQLDPLDQLPSMIEPGAITVTTWPRPSCDASPVGHRWSLLWDGEHTTQWSLDRDGHVVTGSAEWAAGHDLSAICHNSSTGTSAEGQWRDLAPPALFADGAGDPNAWIVVVACLAGLVAQLPTSSAGRHVATPGPATMTRRPITAIGGLRPTSISPDEPINLSRIGDHV